MWGLGYLSLISSYLDGAQEQPVHDTPYEQMYEKDDDWIESKEHPG